jgi:membrane protein
MVLRIDNAAGGRIGIPVHPAPVHRRSTKQRPASTNPFRRIWHGISTMFYWGLRGYQEANAGDLAAAVAFNAMIALVPTFLLCLSVAGLFLRIDDVLISTIYSSLWGLPPGAASDALDAALTARRNSTWLGALSLTMFAWTGTGFVSCLARSMNRIYGVPNCGYICEKRRGFFVILAFAMLFLLALIASTVPTLFVNADLPAYFQSWTLAEGTGQLLGYGLAILAAVVLFGVLYRVVPNAGQHLLDIWPGALAAAALFVVIAQVFPIYLRLIGGSNRYGAAFGLVTLLVAWFYALAHLLLFGAYVNATYHRHRRRRRARRA